MYLGNPANWHLPLLRSKLPHTGIGTCNQFVAVTLPCPFALSHLWPHRWEHSGHLTQAEAIKVLLSRIWTWVKEAPARLCWPLKLRTWNLHDFAWTLHKIVVSQLPNVHGSGGTGGRKEQEGETEWREHSAWGPRAGGQEGEQDTRTAKPHLQSWFKFWALWEPGHSFCPWVPRKHQKTQRLKITLD